MLLNFGLKLSHDLAVAGGGGAPSPNPASLYRQTIEAVARPSLLLTARFPSQVETDGGAVTRWLDLSTNRFHAAVEGAGEAVVAEPVEGKTALRINEGQYLVVRHNQALNPGTDGLTVFMVFRLPLLPDNPNWLLRKGDAFNPTNDNVEEQPGYGINAFSGADPVSHGLYLGYDATSRGIARQFAPRGTIGVGTSVIDPANGAFSYLHGTAGVAATGSFADRNLPAGHFDNAADLKIGATFDIAGKVDLYELIVIPRALGESEQAAIRAILAEGYGLA